MKYYINENGNYCSYDYIPNFTAEDGMTEISAEEYNDAMETAQREYEEAIAEELPEAVVYAEISEVLNEA